uniref:Pentacotripeptide-repeat region of PRORP domain-containing protein n=1 Tax=Alexandrium catenella TaxID=2925 RepID=A0A7S1QJE4_ALECA
MHACERVLEWRPALALLADMQSRVLAPGSFAYNAAVLACSRTGHWRRVLQLVEDMREATVAPDAVTCHFAVGACEDGGQAAPAASLLAEVWELAASLLAAMAFAA